MSGMRFYKLVRVGVFLSLILMLISGCIYHQTQKINVGDGGLLSAYPCPGPCFWNITPGVTTVQMAKDILSTKLELNNWDYWDTRINGGSRGMGCSNVTLTFDDNDVVNGVGFSPTQNITVDDVIKKYGTPNAVFIAHIGIEMEPPLAVLLYFDKVNMIIHLPEQDNTTYELLPDTPIEQVVYESQDAYKNTNKPLIQNWKGYGDYIDQ